MPPPPPDSGISFQILARRIERSPLSDDADNAGYIIADRISDHKLQCDQATIDRIFKLFKCQRRSETLVGIESGSITPFSPASLSQFSYHSTWKCLWALAVRFAEEPSLSHIRYSFIAHLDTICRWFRVMTNLCHFKVGDETLGACLAPSSRSLISHIVSSLMLQLLLGDPTIEARICSDPQMIRVAVGMWVLKAKFDDDKSQEGPSLLFNRVLEYHKKHRSDGGNQSILDSFDEFKLDYGLVADIALDYLQTTSNEPNWNPRDATMNLEILRYLYVSFTPIKWVLVKRNMETQVMKVLKRVTQALHDGSVDVPEESHISVLGYALWVSHQVMYDGDTTLQVIRCIQEGLLPILIKCDVWIEHLMTVSRNYLQALLVFFSHLFPRLCMFKSFVVVLNNELAALDRLGIGTNVSNPHLGFALDELKQLVREQMDILHRTRYEPVRVYRVCSGPNCQARDIDYRFRRCRGCLSYYYCSVECQKVDWQFHKEDCKNWRQTFSHIMDADIPSSDMKPLKKLIAYHLTMMSVSPKYHAEFEQSIEKTVIIELDFKEPPFGCSVNVDDGGAPGIQISATVYRGGYSRQLHFTTTLEELRNV